MLTTQPLQKPSKRCGLELAFVVILRGEGPSFSLNEAKVGVGCGFFLLGFFANYLLHLTCNHPKLLNLSGGFLLLETPLLLTLYKTKKKSLKTPSKIGIIRLYLTFKGEDKGSADPQVSA